MKQHLWNLLTGGTVLLTTLLMACAALEKLPNRQTSHQETLARGQQVNCVECHDDQNKGTLKSVVRFSHSPTFVKNHRFPAASDSRLCASCHKESFCADCHTPRTEILPSRTLSERPDRELPHRGNYLTIHKIEGKMNPASCNRCHGRGNNDRCMVCHS